MQVGLVCLEVKDEPSSLGNFQGRCEAVKGEKVKPYPGATYLSESLSQQWAHLNTMTVIIAQATIAGGFQGTLAVYVGKNWS